MILSTTLVLAQWSIAAAWVWSVLVKAKICCLTSPLLWDNVSIDDILSYSHEDSLTSCATDVILQILFEFSWLIWFLSPRIKLSKTINMIFFAPITIYRKCFICALAPWNEEGLCKIYLNICFVAIQNLDPWCVFLIRQRYHHGRGCTISKTII